jgi:hypothetical protein
LVCTVARVLFYQCSPYQKPLAITIGQLLTPYCPGGRQGNSKQSNDENVPTLLAIFLAVAVSRYNTARIA